MGRGRWGDQPAHHDPHESPWVMRGPARRAGRGRRRRRASSTSPGCTTTASPTSSQPVFATSLFDANAHPAQPVGPRPRRRRGGPGGDRRRLALWRVRRGPSRHSNRRFLQRVWYWDDFYDATIGRPGQALARFSATVVDGRVIDGAVNGVATLVRSASTGGPTAPDRLRPQLRARHRPRVGGHPRLRGQQDVVVVSHSPGFPFLTVLVILPAAGALVSALCGARAALGHRGRRGGDRRGHPRLRHRDGGAPARRERRLPVRLAPRLGELARDRLVRRRRRDLPLPRAPGRRPLPDRAAWAPGSGTTSASFTAWMLLLEAACIGSFVSLDLVLFFLFFELTLVPAYFLIAEWGYARRAYAAIKFFVYTFLGSAFLLVGIVVAGLRPPEPDRRAHVLASRARAHPSLLDHRDPALRGLHRRLRGEGAAVPVPHLVARRVHRGADRGLGRPRRGHGQARHLRDHPLRSQPVPPGVADPRPAPADPGGDRHPVRRAGGVRPARPEAARRLLVARPDRLHRPRHVRLHHRRALRRGAPDGQPRADRRRASSSSSAGSTSAARPGRSPSSEGCRAPPRCWRRSSPW